MDLRYKGGTRIAAAAVLAAFLLIAPFATDAGAARGQTGAKPKVKVLTKDERSALATNRLVVRVGVARRARVRVRLLGLDLGPRPGFVASERKLRFTGRGTRTLKIKLSRDARKALKRARAACRSVRIAAFASARRYRPGHDSGRTTLVRHARTLGPARSDCSGVPPGLGGPGLGGPVGGSTPRPTDAITIRAGAASSDSTPPVGTPMFAYTARSNIAGPSVDRPLQLIADPDENLYAKTFVPSQGIHTRIRARAIVIEAGGKKYALAQVDLGGHPYAFTQEVLRRIAGTGITGDRLFLSSTHTHSSSGAIWSADNSGYASLGGDLYDPRVFEMVVSGVAEAISAANQRLQPARVGVGTAEVRDASGNRNFDPFKLNPETPADENEARAASIDPRLTVVRVDAGDGTPLGVWSNFAIHPTSFGDDNLLFSGDNPATTERLVEDEMVRDAAARGVAPRVRPVDVWTNANEGDISPNGGPDVDATEPAADHRALQNVGSRFAGANVAGRRVAVGVMAAWRRAGAAMSGSPAIDSRRTFMNLDGTEADGEPVGPIPVLGGGGITYPDGTCAPADDLAGPGQGKKFPLFGGPGVVPNVHPVSLLRLGPLAIVGFPSEITKTMGARIRSAVAAEAGGAAPAGAIISGLTNSYNSYTATPEEYDACHYEGSFTLWGRRQGSRYRDLARGLAQSVYGGAPPSGSAAEPQPISPGSAQPPSVRVTPSAGTIVTDAPDSVPRLGQAQFKWNGGDPAIDAPRGRALVTLELDRGRGFEPVATEDSVVDATEHARDDTWTETWQFTECDALGTYRFVVRGVANKGSGAAPYRVVSKPFQLRPANGIGVYSKTIAGGVVHVRAEYTKLPTRPLAVLPLRVRTGFAILRVRRPGGSVTEEVALPDAAGLEFTARVPAGSTADVVSVEDACGNTT